MRRPTEKMPRSRIAHLGPSVTLTGDESHALTDGAVGAQSRAAVCPSELVTTSDEAAHDLERLLVRTAAKP